MKCRSIFLGLLLLLVGCKPDLELLANTDCVNLWEEGLISARGPTAFCGREALQALAKDLSARAWHYEPLGVYYGLDLVSRAETLDHRWGLDLIRSKKLLVLRNGSRTWTLSDEGALAAREAAFSKLSDTTQVLEPPKGGWPFKGDLRAIPTAVLVRP